jgi:3-phenylpropionate/cinnamic acid dioxygenase small subunit
MLDDAIPDLDDSIRLHFQVSAFHCLAAKFLDDEAFGDWVDLFVEDATYRLIPLENHERDLPISIIHCESRGMIADRVHAAVEATMSEPRTIRHFVSNVRVTSVTDATIKAEANVFVTETMVNRMTRILISGFYLDTLARTADGLRIKDRTLVYDSLIIPNSIVAPL